MRGSSSDSNSSTEDLPLNRDGEPVSRGQARKMERQAEREKHEKEVEEHVATQQKRKEEAEAKACLLYTSPSPRDGLLSRMPSSA